MAWYMIGTVDVTNGSAIVTLTGGDAMLNIFPDDGFIGPDGSLTAIATIDSAVQFTLASDYQGVTASGENYAVVPVGDHITLRQMNIAINDLITNYQEVAAKAGTGQFENGSAASPGVRSVEHGGTGLVWNDDGTLSISVDGTIVWTYGEEFTFASGTAAEPSITFTDDPDTGIYNPDENVLGFALSGLEVSRFDEDGVRFRGRARINSFGGTPSSPIETADWPIPALAIRAFDDSYTDNTMIMFGLPNDDAYILDHSIWNMRLHHSAGAIASADVTGMSYGGPGFLIFAPGGNEKARFTPDGKFGLGLADPGDFKLSVFGGQYTASVGSNDSQTSMRLWNGSSGGGEWYLVTGGSGGVASDRKFAIYDWTAAANRFQITKFGEVCPGSDNSQPFGIGSFRWSVIFSATGTINTSDERDKKWLRNLNDDEINAANRIGDEIGFYQWIDSIANKGDDARIHVGVRAQRVWSIMADEGLIDPIQSNGEPGKTPYAFLCWDKWDAVGEIEEIRDENDNIVSQHQPARDKDDRFGIRVDQLNLFLFAALKQQLKEQDRINEQLTARIEALETRFND